MQQSLTLRCHISFEAITSDGDEGTLCNSLKERDKVLKVQSDCIQKALGSLTVEQEDKGSHYGTED